MPDTELWEALRMYCKQLQYGEIQIKIKIHQGEAVEFEEIIPPVRKFRKGGNDEG